ncbi:unnamed protein product [Anisakis simplex]|uniref:Alpha-mannosidase 2C1 (inferred by orthology to a human protein) n=1 Tax=Anisakis simplex TaxID=6269 RepID=A0A0M3J6H4_ANISI|nr:unnamed protein product [Anisakis simplex]
MRIICREVNNFVEKLRYEVCAHKWMSLCEYNRGAALLNNCKYGHSCDGNIMRISLLRSSKSPDENADIGRHQFSYAFYPFIGSIQQPNGNAAMSVMRCAFEFNNPVRYLEGIAGTISEHIDNVFKISGSDGVIIDTIKASEDDENALIMRLFECFGGSARIWLHWNHARIVSIDLADGLEQSISNIPIESTIPNESEQEDVPSESVKLEFHAFELKTLLIRLFAM